jgi:hypothetical protein
LTKPKPLDNEQVVEAISAALNKPYGKLFPSTHIRERMKKRHFGMNDVIKVLDERKRIKPFWNTDWETGNYDVGGEDTDGEPLTIRVAIIKDEGLVLVTGF